MVLRERATIEKGVGVTKVTTKILIMGYSIAIDGPAGAGKSTIAKEVAKKLGFIYVDTGAMYRAMALFFLRRGISPEDTKRIEEECEQVNISIQYQQGVQVVLLNGENVNHLIRTEEVGKMASATSTNGQVRRKLVALQQELAQSCCVVMDGRDIGTCVLPSADVKVYLTADSKVRAKRRYLELKEKGEVCDLNTIEEDIKARDLQDMNRKISPLRQAQDAVLIDSSQLSPQEVMEKIYLLVQETGYRENEE